VKNALRALLVGGAMYEPLYSRLSEFTALKGLEVEVIVTRDHPELNHRLEREFSSGTAQYDLVSTHTKYAPSQRQWLTPLPEFSSADLADFEPRTVELGRIDDALYSLPRNLDVKLLHWRTDLMDAPPTTWQELLTRATALTFPPDQFGFAFPGKESGLFGHFFELQAMAGGQLFAVADDGSLELHLNDSAGHWALELLVALYRQAAPPQTTDWHYDDVATCFRNGHAAISSDWPAGFAAYNAPESRVAGRFDLALYPSGAAGRHVYAGCHSFAIPGTVRDRPAALELLRFLTDPASQRLEARQGSLPARRSALGAVRSEVKTGSLEMRRWELLEQAARCALVPPKFGAYPVVEDAIWRGLRRALLGEWDVAEALERIEASGRAAMKLEGDGQRGSVA
jgi:multiple sugar transport system substrate-binding protein